MHRHHYRAVPRTCEDAEMVAATARQPSRTVGYFGTHAHSSRSLRFEIRKLLANISPSEPKRYFIHGGAS